MPADYKLIPLPFRNKEQLNLGLPLSSTQTKRIEKDNKALLRAKRLELQRRRMAPYHAARTVNDSSVTTTIAYEELISRHMDQLNQIRESEQKILSPRMMEKWNNVQWMLRSLKAGRSFDYSEFLKQFFDLLYYLKLY